MSAEIRIDLGPHVQQLAQQLYEDAKAKADADRKLTRMAYSKTETAKLLSLSVSMISKLIELGELRAFSTSDRAGKTLIPRTELVRYIDSRVATRKRQYPKRMRAS